MKNLLTFCFILFVGNICFAQQYQDYLGAGHTVNVTVTSSNNNLSSNGINTINAAGLQPDQLAASRFLAHATLGADYETIDYVNQVGFSQWLDEQFNQGGYGFLKHLDDTLAVAAYSQFVADGGLPDDFGTWGYFRYVWWESAMTGNDLLRDRVALALSEIFVVSEKSSLFDYAEGQVDYYEMLYNNAFGNFRDLLYDVTVHPTMGFYLSHANNPKSNPTLNRYPDENYAREIMQLFTIGLYELNNDGSRKTTAAGDFIPTYDSEDVREFAKVFTGLAGADWSRHAYEAGATAWGPFNFGEGIWATDLTQPLIMYEGWHEQGAKYLLNGQVVPSGQTGMQDVNNAIDNLYNHPNVGPFIGYKLIQRLVKSNPTPEYIERVSNIFNDNGQGIRGDMQAVIRAILMDSEARDCSWLPVSHHGMLKEPIVRYTHACRAFNAYNSFGRFYNSAWNFNRLQEQHPLASPSVFNFFQPDYQPIGDIADLSLFAPEFQIFNSSTSLNYVNLVHSMALWDWVFDEFVEWQPNHQNIVDADYTSLNLTDEFALITSSNPTILDAELDQLLDRLDIILTHGNMSDRTRSVIKNAAMEYGTNQWASSEWIVRFAIYFTMISPDYAILK